MAVASRVNTGGHSRGLSDALEDCGKSLTQRVPFKENKKRHGCRAGRSLHSDFNGGFGEGRESYNIRARSRNENFFGRRSNRIKYRAQRLRVERSWDSECFPTMIKHYFHEGVYIQPEMQDVILTLNLVPEDAVSNDKIVCFENGIKKHEYRIWNPFTSKLAASIMKGITDIYIRKGSRVLYLGSGSCSTISHVSDIVGCEGIIYALETSLDSSTDLQTMAKLRKNIKPIKGDPTHPAEYKHKLQGLVDVIICDLAQLEQASVLALNARYFLKYEGNFIIFITVAGNDRTNTEAMRARNLLILIDEKLKPFESQDLQPYVKDHYIITGIYVKKREINYRRFCSKILA